MAFLSPAEEARIRREASGTRLGPLLVELFNRIQVVSDRLAITVPAAEFISKYQVVWFDDVLGVESARPSDNTNLTLVNSTVGIATNTAATGVDVEVQTTGLITNGLWAWTPKLPIFLDSAGGLTQTPPTTPNTLRIKVGKATTATTMFIDIKEGSIIK